MSEIAAAAGYERYPWENIKPVYEFDEHPLGLHIPPAKLVSRRSVLLFGWYTTEVAVKSMSKFVLARLGTFEHPPDDTYLRINQCDAGLGYARGSDPAGSWLKFDYVFELGWKNYAFMVGACNNHTGESGRGGERLKAVFEFASDFLSVPLMIQTINEDDWQHYNSCITQECVRQDKERVE
jgi:hypothetical protein